MWYSYLLTSPELECPLFTAHLPDEYEVPITGNSRVFRREKWERFKREFCRIYTNLNTYRVTLLNLDLIVAQGYIGVVIEEQIKILVLETNNILYIDKEFETTYRKLYLKIKDIMLDKFNSDKDVIYTNNCGKNSFYQFEKPKCKSISERNDYVKELLDEYYESR